MSDQKRACRRCEWWDKCSGGLGLCHRLPNALMPTTGEWDWCGEFLERGAPIGGTFTLERRGCKATFTFDAPQEAVNAALEAMGPVRKSVKEQNK